jgi:hypothetical protein
MFQKCFADATWATGERPASKRCLARVRRLAQSMSAADGQNADDSGLASAADRVKGRLDALQAQRQAASQQRRAAAADASDPEQDTRSFQLRLEAVKRDVNSSLNALRGAAATGGGSAPPSLDTSQRAELLRTALERVSELEQVCVSPSSFRSKEALSLFLLTLFRTRLAAHFSCPNTTYGLHWTWSHPYVTNFTPHTRLPLQRNVLPSAHARLHLACQLFASFLPPLILCFQNRRQ